MIDIIPAAVLASVSAVARKEYTASQKKQGGMSQGSGTGSSYIEVMPDPDSVQIKNRRKGALISLAFAVSVVVLGVIIGFVFRDNIALIFTGQSGSAPPAFEQSLASIDEDSDGLTTLEEMAAGTLVSDSDTDKDGLPDGFEIDNGLNPLDPTDSAHDEDADGLNNADEYTYQSKINDPDTDKDGFKDGAEVRAGYNPSGPGVLIKKTDDSMFEPVVGGVISIEKENFNPQFIRIKKGDSITFVNNDSISHSVTGPEIETGNILPTKTFILSFTEEGTFEFYDRNNAEFKGKILVETEK